MKKLYGYEYYIYKILELEKISNGLDQLKNINETKEEAYNKFQIPKKSGKRDICSIDNTSILYIFQKKLNKNFLTKIPLSPAAIGFTKGNSYNDYLAKHIGKKYHMRIDIKDFFGSITEDHIRNNFIEFIQDKEIIDSIINICLFEEKVPQGAVTSPAISNIVFRKIDQRIIKYCQAIQKVHSKEADIVKTRFTNDDTVNTRQNNEDIIYTRYADDLLFSSDFFDFKQCSCFYKMIKKILDYYSFKINTNKIYYSQGLISLSGFVVNNDIHLSRKKIKNVNSILYFFDKRSEYNSNKYEINKEKIKDPKVIENINALNLKNWNGNEVKFRSISQLVNYLCGYRAFLISFLKLDFPETDDIKIINKKVIKIERLVDEFNTLAEKSSK
jgi:hypothetical protein